MTKLIIAGSRHYNNYEHVEHAVDIFLATTGITPTEIVSGGARGVDALGERYAQERGIPLTRFPANWDEHGRAAGPIRNAEMATYADVLVAFSSGGRGTENMIAQMATAGKPRHVVKVG